MRERMVSEAFLRGVRAPFIAGRSVWLMGDWQVGPLGYVGPELSGVAGEISVVG